MINPRDLHVCRDAIRHGSLSFYTASKLLPVRVRDPATEQTWDERVKPVSLGEERRLLYVGITRAQDQLFDLLWHGE